MDDYTNGTNDQLSNGSGSCQDMLTHSTGYDSVDASGVTALLMFGQGSK